ncbi:MAG: TldD/PmbA family protein, partial [Polyangiales bacterium]
MTDRYHAPFGEGGVHAIDRDIAERLLRVALERGGDYADLFFEYGVSGSYVYDEQILKSARRAVSMGLGVRVMKGDATGYAYCEDLDYDVMKRAAQTAAQIASGGKPIVPVAVAERELPSRYPVSEESFEVDGLAKKALLERADQAARAADPRVVRVDASFNESVREILVANSLGHIARDRQPLIRFGVRVIVEDGDQRQSGSSGGGGRVGLVYFDGKSPEWHAAQAVQQALTMLDAREAPAGEMDVVLAPGDSGILLHEAVGHGLEADFNRKKTSNYTDRVGEEVASALCTVVDDASLEGSRGSINVDDEGQLPTRSVLIEDGGL